MFYNFAFLSNPWAQVKKNSRTCRTLFYVHTYLNKWSKIIIFIFLYYFYCSSEKKGFQILPFGQTLYNSSSFSVSTYRLEIEKHIFGYNMKRLHVPFITPYNINRFLVELSFTCGWLRSGSINSYRQNYVHSCDPYLKYSSPTFCCKVLLYLNKKC